MSPAPVRPAILVVEDEALVLTTLRVTLERESFEVVTCGSPVEAIRLFEGREFAVVVSDLRMPEMTGLEFLAECRRIRPQTSRILLTAFLDLATVVQAINRGDICKFLSKPWLREELVAAIRDAADRHDLATDNRELRAEAERLSRELAEARRGQAAAC